MTARQPVDALRGWLDLLILNTLSLEPMYGWGMSYQTSAIVVRTGRRVR